MTTEQANNLRLHHILEATGHISDFIEGVSSEEFENNYEKQSAVIRQFEIIGEAAGKLSFAFTERHKEIDWPKVVSMRHKMIHDYFEVNISIIWDTAIDDVPLLKKQVQKILNDK